MATTPFPGSLSQLSLNAPVVDAVASSAGEGAWLLGRDGGIFALKSPFYGNAVDEANPPPVFPGTVIGNGGYVGKVPCPGGGSVTVAAQIAQNTSNLLAAARQGGIILCGWGWRSTETQIQLRKKKTAVVIPPYNIWQKPASQCEPGTAVPGRSQRERGLAIDFFNAQGSIKKPSREFDWLKQHAGTYGLKKTSRPKPGTGVLPDAERQAMRGPGRPRGPAHHLWFGRRPQASSGWLEWRRHGQDE